MENSEALQGRSVLLAAARARMEKTGDFSIGGLLTDTGLSRAEFRCYFEGKADVLAALTDGQAQALGGLLAAAAPVEMGRAVGSDLASTPGPSMADAWLERRLRVFERALAGLEKRQQRTEQEFNWQLALLTERLEAIKQPSPVELFDPAESNLMPAEPLPAGVKPAETSPGAEPALAMQPAFSVEPAPAEAARPALPASIEELVPPDAAAEPVNEKQMAEFLAQARRSARATALPQQPRRRPPRMREAVTLAAILIGGLVMIAGTLLIAGAASPGAMASSAIAARQPIESGSAHIVALADSGNADAQTVLALANLRANARSAARRWSVAAAQQGQPVAQYLLGTLALEDHQSGEAKHWLGAAAARGNLKAMHNLGVLFAQGSPQEAALAAQWFSRAAEQGYRDSAFDLGVLYERGVGVPQDGAAALKWYLVAAAEGDAPSAERAATLRGQLKPSDAEAAGQAASSFVPRPADPYANAPPDL